jgi:hypothetical protein
MANKIFELSKDNTPNNQILNKDNEKNQFLAKKQPNPAKI